jgi:teichoic acid ribitol-phosphate primase
LTRLEFLLAGTLLRLLAALFSLLPLQKRKVVLATARLARLEGNLAYLHAEMRRRRPDLRYVLLLQPYSYGLAGKLAYLGRLIVAMYHVRTARLIVIDNAYLPVHVAPPRRGATVVQVWHAVAALKRFGVDTAVPVAEPERTFLHRYYTHAVVSSEATRRPAAAALRTPLERVLALGTPRTDFFFDQAALAQARDETIARYPALSGRRVVLYAPTFRGRGRAKAAAAGLDTARLRRLLPDELTLALKTHPNLDPSATDDTGFDVVVEPDYEINRVLAATDILVTDYSSSIFEFALLRRPIILLVPDLADYERDPGLYLDYRTEMIGVQVATTDEVAAAVTGGQFDLAGYEAFIERHLGACDGHASERFVEHFLPTGRRSGPSGPPAAAE